MEPTREIYWNITYGGLIYALAAVAAAFIGTGIYRRWRLWRLAGPAARFDRLPERLRGLVAEIFGHRRQLRDPLPGAAHLLIFYGFLAQLIATSLIAIQEWTGIHYLKGTFYLGFSLGSDVLGLLAIAGLLLAMWHRGVTRPSRLHSVLGDWFGLALLLVIFVQGFAVEGLRIATTELRQQPDLARWSPGGYAVALALANLPPETLRSLHRVNWWLHAATAMFFLGYLVYGKFSHILYGIANVFFRNLGPSGRLVHPDIEALAETDPDALDSLGTGSIDQFTWKDLLDVDACVNCGRCEAVCPATLSGVPLSPRKLIQDMHHHLSEAGPGLLAAAAGAEAPASGPLLFGEDADGSPRASISEAELWGCRTCGACQQECPLFIEHIPKIVGMRRHLVMTQSKLGDDAQLFLKNLDDRMHPWVGAPLDREHWYQDLDVKVLGNGEKAEYLYWVGCTGAMQERNVATTRAMVKILTAAGVDFGILGPEEVCTGDPARRAGGELTFQICAKTNIETLARYGVTKIITTCPHCFNTVRNEYPDFGGHYEVIHHTQMIAELLRSGRLSLGRKLDSVTYHDPCYLGRHNGVYDEPRAVLSALAAPGAFVELERHRSKSLCCGSGGGYAWMDDDPKQRINHMRIEEVKACGADTAAVSCPFCMQMFEDALKAKDPGRTIRAADIAELVAEALEEAS